MRPEAPKPFWDRHFASLLTFVGVFLAAILAISDTAVRIFVNQPPGARLKLNSTQVEAGARIFAYAIANDPDGSPDKLQYSWVLFPPGDLIHSGVGRESSWVELQADVPGEYSLVVTVTDKKGRGKAEIADVQFQVEPKAPGQQQQATPPPRRVERISLTESGPAFSDSLSLSNESIVNWSEVQADSIVTNGNKLTLIAERIDRDLRIVAFEGPASGGRDGQPGSPGGNGGRQSAGAPGGPGDDGKKGGAGASAGQITIRVSEELAANLTIDNSGQNGGAGGQGGSGGPGGSGGRGKPSRSGVLDCSSGPGWGGAGGNGGNGGDGGDSGPGGNAGPVVVELGSVSSEASVRIVSLGGAGGRPGLGGQAGAPGAGGPEGEVRGLCRPAGRQGQTGRAGIAGAPGAAKGQGTAARASLEVSSRRVASQIGEVVYSQQPPP